MAKGDMVKKDLVASDIRYPAFQKAIRFVNYELVEGDVFEFGVYTGRSFALLSIANDEYYKHSIHKVNFNRDFYGFDSFQGMYKTGHPRWADGVFAVSHSWHPTIKIGEKVTKKKVEEFFKLLKLQAPKIVEGEFQKATPEFMKKYTGKVAIVHMDGDTYENTKTILTHIEPALQEGTVLLFDDWFNYRGSLKQGEAKAFNEFAKKSKKFSFVDYFQYGTFCKAFIAVKK